MGLQKHLRNTFLAGIFAAIPVAVTAFIIYYVDDKTRPLSTRLTGYNTPFLGIAITLAGVYVLGLIVSSLVGRYILRVIDALLRRLPIVRELYAAWKHIALTPGGGEGTFGKVVLIPVETGQLRMIGFTSGQGIPADPETVVVFVPAVPNPINGRLYFIKRCDCQFLDMSPEEAFKVVLSNGNYVPRQIGEAMAGKSGAEVAQLQSGT